MRKIFRLLPGIAVGVFIWAALQTGAFAATYYVDSAAGDDQNPGTTQNAPWRTLDNINAKTFTAGDSILFRAGGVYNGSVVFKGSGQEENPITVGSYGDGAKPVINGKGTSYALLLEDVSYWTISGLEVTNRSVSGTVSTKSGIAAVANFGYTAKGIRIENNTVTAVDGNCGSFDNAGIFCRAIGNFDGLYIAENDIHDLKTIGIYLLSHQDTGITPSYDVHIRGNTITRNGRDGIIVTNAQNPLIEYNKLFYIGAAGDNLDWIAGIFPTRCIDGIIQFNEVAYIVDTGDSYAYDLDVGCTGTFYFQYNYSHDNAGGFYMQPADTMHRDTDKCIVRYNISLRERGSFRIQSDHVEVYNNVLYDTERPLMVGSSYVGGIQDVHFYNNIFVSPGIPEYWPEFTYSSNLYYGHTPPAAHKNSVAADPQFVAEHVQTPDDCRLKDTSPAIGAGQRTDGASRDYAGSAVFAVTPDIGAFAGEAVWVNAVRDCGFENSAPAWELGPPFSVSSEKAYTGAHALKLAGKTSWNGARQDITLLPDTSYQLKFYVTGNAYTSVRILDQNEKIIANSGMFVPADQWEQKTLDFTTDGTGKIRIFIADGGMGINYYDAFSIEAERYRSEVGDNSVKYAPRLLSAAEYTARYGTSDADGILMSCDSGDWICFRNVEFGAGIGRIKLEYAVDPEYAGKNISLRIDQPDGREIGRGTAENTGGWAQFQWMTIRNATVYGTHDLYICFGSGVPSGQFAAELVYGVGNFRNILLQ